MTTSNLIQDVELPYDTFVEGTSPSNPASGRQKVYVDVADHKLKRRDSAGTVVVIEAGTIEVKEIDGSPDVTGVTIIRVSNGSLTNDGGGQVTITTGGGGGGGSPATNAAALITAYQSFR